MTGMTTAARLGFAAAAILVVAAVALRGLPAARWIPPEAQVDAVQTFARPAQMVSRYAEQRTRELAALMPPPRALEYQRLWGLLPVDCPRAAVWLSSARGEEWLRGVSLLQTGTEPEALGALSLLAALVRRVEWEPDGLGAQRSVDAEIVALQFELWLTLRAELGAESPLLGEATLVALLTWGRLLHTVEHAPFVSVDRSVAPRAAQRLDAWFGFQSQRRTRLSTAVAAREPVLYEALRLSRGALAALALASERRDPDLDGECGS
jgi:hypothetical protein